MDKPEVNHFNTDQHCEQSDMPILVPSQQQESEPVAADPTDGTGVSSTTAPVSDLPSTTPTSQYPVNHLTVDDLDRRIKLLEAKVFVKAEETTNG